MRDIKFRAIYKNKVAGYERLSQAGWEWMWLELNPDKGERWTKGCIHDTNEIIRNQFIGLQDKNGKEIYEGDIIQFDGRFEAHRAVVVFDEQHGGFILRWKRLEGNPAREINYWRECNANSGGYYYANDYFEIIGNIYENPELIK